MITTILFVIFLFVAFWMTFINLTRAYYKVSLPGANLFWMAVGWTYVAMYLLIKYGVVSFSR